MIKKGKQNSFLMARNDPKTFASLLEICERYKDAKNPFVQYEKETGTGCVDMRKKIMDRRLSA